MSTPIKVLVTGFGPFLDITTNPSWVIAHHLPSSITGSNGETISIIVPPNPIAAAYNKILAQVPKLIEDHAPDLIIHMGLDVDSGPGVFKIERSAPREGYHDIPDTDRKVFTRAENKKMFGKSPSSLSTALDIDAAVETWRNACSSLNLPKARASGTSSKTNSKGKGKQTVDVQVSDDVGTYVCGFNYYISLLEMQKRTGKRNVLFFHVPRLDSEEQVQVGVRVTQELVKAMIGVLK